MSERFQQLQENLQPLEFKPKEKKERKAKDAKSEASLSVEENGDDWLAKYNDPLPDASGDDKDDFDQLESNEGYGEGFGEGSQDKKRKKKRGKDKKHKKDKKDKKKKDKKHRKKTGDELPNLESELPEEPAERAEEEPAVGQKRLRKLSKLEENRDADAIDEPKEDDLLEMEKKAGMGQKRRKISDDE